MKRLTAYYGGIAIGELEQTSSGRLRFTYTPQWLKHEYARPISQSLPLQETALEERYCIGFFGGLLPEEYNREIIAKNLGITSKNDFAMLNEIGGECAGAITLLPPDSNRTPDEHRYQSISIAELESILDQLPQKPLMAGMKDVRLSLAGAQDKLSLYKDKDGFSIPLNESPSSHIIKPESTRFPGLVENEAYCLSLAQQVNLPSAKASMEQIGKHRCLIVTRYDRNKNDDQLQRLHQEDFCQAMGVPTRIKYQSEGGPDIVACFQLLRSASSQPARDLITLFEAAIFNYLIGNNDAHGKNFSLLYSPLNDSYATRLAPLYDLVSTSYYEELSPKMAMKIGGKYIPADLRLEHWEAWWASIEFSKKQARKQTLTFLDRVEAALNTPDNEIQHAIQKIISHRINRLQKLLKA